MKKLIGLALLTLFALQLGACAKARQQAVEGMIHPGDRVGNLLVIKTEGRDALYPFEYSSRCTKIDETTFSCEHILGKKINVTSGLYDDRIQSSTPTARLEELWSSFDYQLFIEDRPVNLEEFGYI